MKDTFCSYITRAGMTIENPLFWLDIVLACVVALGTSALLRISAKENL